MPFIDRRALIASALAAGTMLAGTAQAAPTEIQLWHAMGGQLGEAVERLVEGYNKGQSEYKIVPVYKGSYTETLTAAIAAFRAKQGPHIVQVFEVGTANMMAAKGAVYPVHKLMDDFKQPLDPKAFIGPVYGYYATPEGKLLSMPFNSSTAVFYWNKDMFKKAGLDPEKQPTTWAEVAEYGKKLVASGAKCGFTTQWQTWIQIENFGAWHNIPFATKQNGFAGTDIQLTINDPARVKHIENLAAWQKDNVFVYGGREGKPTPMFTSGDCGMFMGSAGTAGTIEAGMISKGVPVGTGFLPYYPEVKKEPQNSIIGGATLWVLEGRPKSEYKGVAELMSYLASPNVQAQWHMDTGYVPITYAAYEVAKTRGFYTAKPGRDVAIKQLTLHEPTENSKGLRIGNFVQIRDIMDEELEAVWAGKKTAKQALDSAQERGNKLLAEFARNNK